VRSSIDGHIWAAARLLVLLGGERGQIGFADGVGLVDGNDVGFGERSWAASLPKNPT